MKKILTILALIALFAPNLSAQKIVVAYLTSWSDEMPNPDYVTHINYAFGHVNDTFDGVKIDRPERLKEVANQKGTMKVSLSIGGWTSGKFSEMAASEENRHKFASDCKRVVDEYNLDGIDIDWEYPTSSQAGISSSPDDTSNYTLLMQDIRLAIGDNKLLTLASIASAEFIDFKAIESIVDFVNIMAYDIARPPYHHASLFRSEKTKGVSCQEAVEKHINAGMPPHKLVLGIPFYGHGIGEIPDFIDYKDIIHLSGYIKNRDQIAKVPYLTNENGTLVCTYEDAESITEKCCYIIRNGLKGAMYWDYSLDDSQSTLRKAVANGVLNIEN